MQTPRTALTLSSVNVILNVIISACKCRQFPFLNFEPAR